MTGIRGVTKMADLKNVSILIKTMLRDNYLFEAIAGIDATMPEAQMIIVDDGDPAPNKSMLYDKLRATGHVVLEMPYDSGFGKKSNEAIKHLTRPFLLVGCDDFDFRPKSVRDGIEKMVTVLDGVPEIAIASGRVNNARYEGWLHDSGDRVVEEYIKYDDPKSVGGVTYHLCDLTVNYSLIRASILGFGPKQVHWYDEAKIGNCEHGVFFIEVKRAGHGVAYVPGVNICEQAVKNLDPRYSPLRSRARLPGRICMSKIGLKEYVCFGGGVERA